MSSLYNITTEYRLLLEQMYEQDGDFTEEQLALLEINQEQFKEKAEIYCKLIKQLESDSAFAEKELERISAYIQKKNASKDKLKEVLKNALMIFGEKDTKKDLWRFEVGTFKLGTRKSSSVEIDEDLIDDKWKRISISELNKEDLTKVCDILGKSETELKVKEDILKTPIKEAIEAGDTIEGAVIVDKFGLNIK